MPKAEAIPKATKGATSGKAGKRPVATISLLDDDASPVAGIQLSNYTHPSLADVDGDGDADLLVGAADNELHYFENVGTSSAPSFVARYGDDVPLGLASLRSDERVRAVSLLV